MMISEGRGMQADSIAIRSTMPGRPIVEMTAMMKEASASRIRAITRYRSWRCGSSMRPPVRGPRIGSARGSLLSHGGLYPSAAPRETGEIGWGGSPHREEGRSEAEGGLGVAHRDPLSLLPAGAQAQTQLVAHPVDHP